MFNDLEDSAFENVDLSHLESAEQPSSQPPPSSQPQPSSLGQASRDLLGSDTCKLRLPTCRGIVSRARYGKYDRKQKRKYRKHLELSETWRYNSHKGKTGALHESDHSMQTRRGYVRRRF